MVTVKGLIRGVRQAYIRPLRLKHMDGGTFLAIRVQNALLSNNPIVRIGHTGEMSVDGARIGRSYGSEHLGDLMMEADRQAREIVIVGEKSISGRKVEDFITGLNTGNIPLINSLQGCATVFVSDYNLLSILNMSNLTVIKVSPKLRLNNSEYREVDTFFKKNPSIKRDFRWFNPTQRVVLLRLISKGLVDGMFNFWEVMDSASKTRLLEDLYRINVEQVHTNIETHRAFIEANRDLKSDEINNSSNVSLIPGKVNPPDLDKIQDLTREKAEKLDDFARLGKDFLGSGQFGVVVMAAGAAARFGKGPKAVVKIDEDGLTFMQVAAGDVKKASEKYAVEMPLFVMVSPTNAEIIKRHFHDNDYFGLKPDQVVFFYQNTVSPKIYLNGNLALTPDKKGIDFAPTGHGFVIRGIQEQLAKEMKKRGIRTVVIKNIDNLGSTVRDRSYEEVLGSHIYARQGATVELVRPKVAVDQITGKNKLLDRGGGAFSINDRNVLIELFAVPKEIQDLTAENPFNTLTLTVEVDALLGVNVDAMNWYMTNKDFTMRETDRYRRFQFEQLLGDITHMVDSHFVIVAREGSKGRFLPVKMPGDLEPVMQIFETMEKQKA